MTPLVSVVIPAYNYGRFLGERLNNVFAQPIREIEVIVVDDASTDDTREVAAGFRDSRLRLLSNSTNHGLMVALTAGLMEARGSFIARASIQRFETRVSANRRGHGVGRTAEPSIAA